MSAAVTQWFKGTPVKVGVWNTRDSEIHSDQNFQYWNGRYWGCVCNSGPDEAHRRRNDKSLFQDNDWRGLADKPEADGSGS